MADRESGLGYAEKGAIQAELEALRQEVATLRAEVHRLRFNNGEPITPAPVWPHRPYGAGAPASFMPESGRYTGGGGGGMDLPVTVCVGVAGGDARYNGSGGGNAGSYQPAAVKTQAD